MLERFRRPESIFPEPAYGVEVYRFYSMKRTPYSTHVMISDIDETAVLPADCFQEP